MQVSYGEYGKLVEPVPALAIGETVTVLFPMHSHCFDPDSEFEIIIDVYDEVYESNDLNNTLIRKCS